MYYMYIFFYLDTLIKLDLSKNVISSIPEARLLGFLALEELFLASNRITLLPDIANMSSLRKIDLSNNSISSVGSTFITPTLLMDIILMENRNIDQLTVECIGGRNSCRLTNFNIESCMTKTPLINNVSSSLRYVFCNK